MNLLTTRLNPSTCRSWEEFSSTKELETLRELTDFFHRRVGILEVVQPTSTKTTELCTERLQYRFKRPEDAVLHALEITYLFNAVLSTNISDR